MRVQSADQVGWQLEMPFLGSVETIGGVGITRELFLDQDRYLCFTRLSREEGQWVIG